MTPDPQHLPMFRIDVSADASSGHMDDKMDTGDLIVALLRQVISNQEQQNQLLRELNGHLSASQRQRARNSASGKMPTRNSRAAAAPLPKRSAACRLNSSRI